jgi:hypothetical protein
VQSKQSKCPSFLIIVSEMQLHYHMYYSYARGCTEDFSKKKIFSNTFFSLCKLVDMVYRMKSHQGRFQKKSFSCVLCAFLVFFTCFAGKNAFLDGFLVVFTVVWPLVWLFDPPFLTGSSGHPSCIYILYSLLYQMK